MMGLLFPKLSEKQRVGATLAVTLIPALGFISFGVFLPGGAQEWINTFAWITANVLLAYSAGLLVVFLGAYFYYFDPRATTGGRLIFQFMMSLVGIISLNIIGIFINPSANGAWYLYPEGVEPWRPTVRLVIYGFVAYSITSLAVLLIMRKWFPHRLKTATSITLVKVRHDEDGEVVMDPITPKEEQPRVLRRDPVIPSDLIEETWPLERGENK